MLHAWQTQSVSDHFPIDMSVCVSYTETVDVAVNIMSWHINSLGTTKMGDAQLVSVILQV